MPKPRSWEWGRLPYTRGTPQSTLELHLQAALEAIKDAGLTPSDIDSAQIYDGFTWIVLASLEALGFCKRGEGRDFVRDGRIELGGALPLNTSGGLLSEGHRSGANLVSEAVRQLRREVESERQVSDCQRVLITGEGDFHEGGALILGQAS